MTKFFNKFKKPCFWPFFGPFSQFWGQKKMFGKICLCHAQLHMDFQHHAKIYKKTKDRIPRKCLNRKTDGRKDKLYFIGPFRVPPGAQLKPIYIRQSSDTVLTYLSKRKNKITQI